MDDLDISHERKIEIDKLLKETEDKYKRGEIKARPLKEFLDEQEIKENKIKRVAFEQGCGNEDYAESCNEEKEKQQE